MYSKNGVPGQWKAHGRYSSRDSATKSDPQGVGFDAASNGVDIAERLDGWQKARDQRMWKFIISPEFGDRVDMETLTRELMKRMERDLGTNLDWVGVTHHNTDHKHVHVALRGVDAYGKQFRLEPEYIKHGIRAIAEDLCTRQLGYRTRLDAEQAMQREIGQNRFTSLDRSIKQDLQAGGFYTLRGSNFRQQCIRQRLAVLERMRIATADPNGEKDKWIIREDFEKVLRAAQKAADRQKTLNAHGVAISDDRLPFEVLDMRKMKLLEGRVLVHGEEDSGRLYTMIESIDGRLVLLHQRPEIQKARASGEMQPGHFVSIRKSFADGKPKLEVEDLGHADQVLTNKAYFERQVSRGRPIVQNWKGWLGEYQSARQDAWLLGERGSRVR